MSKINFEQEYNHQDLSQMNREELEGLVLSFQNKKPIPYQHPKQAEIKKEVDLTEALLQVKKQLNSIMDDIIKCDEYVLHNQKLKQEKIKEYNQIAFNFQEFPVISENQEVFQEKKKRWFSKK